MGKYLLLLTLIATGSGLAAQSDSTSFSKQLAKYGIKTSVGFQFWTTYTRGMEIYNAENGHYEPVEDRLNTQLRRTRLSLKGEPFESLSFNLTAALDLVGKGLLSATEAGANNSASPNFRIWNAFLQWRLVPEKDYLHLVGGYQVLQIGRESITSALRSTSMEKSWSQNYLRRHLTGIGPGRAMGLNLGGLLLNKHSAVHLEYNLGVFNPVFESYNGNSTGLQSSPLVVGRAIVHFGDPESPQYGMNHKVNYFGKRKGLSVGFSLAEQRATDLFHDNRAVGGDILFNWGPLNIDGEYYHLYRTSPDIDATPSYSVHSETGYARISYNLALPKKLFLEPVGTYWFFSGPLDQHGQSQALRLKSAAGEDRGLDLGGNFYWNPDFKISLHYTWRWGAIGAGEAGANFNNYFSQSGVGAIRRGDWWGLGLVAVL